MTPSQTHIQLGEIDIAVTFKAIKNAHLAVHPPDGRVTLVAPLGTRLEVARAFAISKLGWIRHHQERFAGQARETPRQFITRESHYIWGKRYLLDVVVRDQPASVSIDHRQITFSVRPGTDMAKREAIYQAWQRSLLHEVIPAMIARWEERLGVRVKSYFLQRMKTKWGSCNYRHRHIRLNTELVKKPKDLLEYIIVHEMIHLLEPSHNERFKSLLDQHYPLGGKRGLRSTSCPWGADKGCQWRINDRHIVHTIAFPSPPPLSDKRRSSDKVESVFHPMSRNTGAQTVMSDECCEVT